MERRSFLNTLTAGLVAAPAPGELPPGYAHARESAFEKAYREKLLGNIRDYIDDLDHAPLGDLSLLEVILNGYGGSAHMTTDRTSELCRAIEIEVTGFSVSRVKVDDGIQAQVEAVADVLEALHEKQSKTARLAWETERDVQDILGAVAAFLCAANKEQVDAFAKGVSRHFARLQA